MKLKKLFISIILMQMFAVAYFSQEAESILFDEFSYGNREDMMVRIDNFTINLQNDPQAKGYIIHYGDKRSGAKAAKQIKDYLKQRGFDLDGFVFLRDAGDSKVLVQLWLVPEGAEPPAPKNPESKKGMDKTQIIDLLEELEGVVLRLTPDKNEAKLVVKKWGKRKDLEGKAKADVIELLYEDVKSVIKDSGTQYQIYSTFSFYKTVD